MVVNGYWQTTVTPDSRPPLAIDLEVDVAVVGAGCMGLSTAHALCQIEPNARVIVLDSAQPGDEATGYSAGFALTSFGLNMERATALFGKTSARRAHLFMQRAVDNVGAIVREHRIACDYERTGLLTVARTPAQFCRLRHEMRLVEQLGLEGCTWIDGATLRGLVNLPQHLGARAEARCALLNPAKLARGLRTRAEAAGAVVYEHTPIRLFTAGTSGKRHRLLTPSGVVKAERVVFTTNSYTVQFPALRCTVLPVHTTMALTEPLSDEQLLTVGWAGRQGLEDDNTWHYLYRLTTDNRVLIYGYAPGSCANTGTNQADSVEHSAPTVCALFPGLRGIHIASQRSGKVLAPQNLAYSLGYLGAERRVVYGLGGAGQDVAFPIHAGELLAALTFDRPHADRDLLFVNRRILPLPPEPIRFTIQYTAPSDTARPFDAGASRAT